MHYYRIDFDGKNLDRVSRKLNGDHTRSTFSPDNREVLRRYAGRGSISRRSTRAPSHEPTGTVLLELGDRPT